VVLKQQVHKRSTRYAARQLCYSAARASDDRMRKSSLASASNCRQSRGSVHSRDWLRKGEVPFNEIETLSRGGV